MTLSDARFLQLKQWLQQQFDASVDMQLISGDASFRRYFRVTTADKSYIVADSPPEKVDNRPFLALADAYHRQGIPVPAIISVDATQGFILQQDLGDQSLLSLLTSDNVKRWYQQALALLPQIAAVKASSSGPLPQYDAAFVQRELEIFPEWLLAKHWHLTLRDAEIQQLQQVFALLTENALAQPLVGMHRDFHSRNLMVMEKQLYVIDFQDAVLGPITYDAVSLLRDCYVRWPDAVVDALRDEYYQHCITLGLLDRQTSAKQFCRWFDLMGLQRHLKAAGIFARLLHRDGKSGYIKDIPLTLAYVADISERYPELFSFSQWVRQRLLPLCGENR
ncbi:phosphotransferase [Shewanella sp. A32]|uniref:aminoglycoside phosphotransferase family protein n=1 Tax=Shewanella sp. A32 TaxID=3031327 RepID=UPI0023B9D689|nr:phosphotransferase [Shewanella sp. A32]MDF0533255.1 phosphotransferase [Shewanella sp. A32]